MSMSLEGRDCKSKGQQYKGQGSSCVFWQDSQRMKMAVWIEVQISNDSKGG